MIKKVLLAVCLMVEIIFVIGAVKPPMPESPKLAYLSMKQAQNPSDAQAGEVEQERARLNRQQQAIRAGFILAFSLNGTLILKLIRKS